MQVHQIGWFQYMHSLTFLKCVILKCQSQNTLPFTVVSFFERCTVQFFKTDFLFFDDNHFNDLIFFLIPVKATKPFG